MLKFLLIFTLLGPCAAPCGAAEEPFLKETLSRTGEVLASPLHINGESALWLGGLTAGGLLVYSHDTQIRRVLKKNRFRDNDDAAEVLEKFGNGTYELAFLGAYGGLGYVLKRPRMKRTAELAFESFAAANTAGTLFKYVFGRARPYGDDGKCSFRPFKMKTSNTSFPSGHTTSAFSLASVFASRSESAAVSVLAYSLASGVALQRVYGDKHWASDTFAGAVLGTAVGRWLVRREKSGAAASVLLLPVYARGYSGAAAVYGF